MVNDHGSGLVERIAEEMAEWSDIPVNERALSPKLRREIELYSTMDDVDAFANCLNCGRSRGDTEFGTMVLRCLQRQPYLRNRSCSNVFPHEDPTCIPLRESSPNGEITISSIASKLQVSDKDRALLAQWMLGTLPLDNEHIAKPIPPKLYELLNVLGQQGTQLLTLGDKYCGPLQQCAGKCLACFSGLMQNSIDSRYDFYANGTPGYQYQLPDSIKRIFVSIGNYMTPVVERVGVFASALPQKS